MYRTIRISLLTLALSGFLLSLNSCQDTPTGNPTDNPTGQGDEWRCGEHNGKTLYTGPKGGCYYYNSKGNKTYVDRSECNC